MSSFRVRSVYGCALSAVRAEFDATTDPHLVVCGYTADLRPWLELPLLISVLVNAVYGASLILVATGVTSGIELVGLVHAELSAAIERRDPVRFMPAMQGACEETRVSMAAADQHSLCRILEV